MIARITIEKIRASTLPNSLGIDGRIALTNRKYQSGLMCEGVWTGLLEYNHLSFLEGQVKTRLNLIVLSLNTKVLG